ncbi:hypothetical protein CC99x_007125 [Candidatus Berkiella cookevillensis]|uniref:Uncharacterized protein n=1 Tax=Candidatus Berkiella cookevillensis TaxID=437022 RepID=A0A0Q9YN13_9GAMM|nr:hypothetical protein [Candidatus Berkiella cookevillensis]MCS5708678.1 hypothetical protein [Candidatus Berkiella cookevillensis]
MRSLTSLELDKVSGGEYSVSMECLISINGFWAFMLLAPEFGIESEAYKQIGTDLLAECQMSCGSEVYAYIPLGFVTITDALTAATSNVSL